MTVESTVSEQDLVENNSATTLDFAALLQQVHSIETGLVKNRNLFYKKTVNIIQ